MEYSKEEIIDKYNELRKKLGKQPSLTKFNNEYHISKRLMQKLFGRGYYNSLVNEAGDIPNEFFKVRKSDSELLILWGNFVRKINNIPTESDWLYYEFRPGYGRYHKIFGGISNMPNIFREFAKDKLEWADVLAILPSKKNQEEVTKIVILDETDSSKKYLDFIPRILSDFEELAKSEDKSKSTLFEEKVNLLYQLLGFEVEILGRGTGRNPDGIACDRKNHYAIIYDAKLRKDGYSLGDDDRIIIEYIEKYKSKLNNEGSNKIYYQIISSKFIGLGKEALKNVFKKTGVQVTLISSKNILKLLSRKIEFSNKFDLNDYQDFLIEHGEISDKNIEKFILKFN
jgi:hypothetical protein